MALLCSNDTNNNNLYFQFLNNKKVGIGSENCFDELCLSDIKNTINNYSKINLTIKAKETKLLDISNIADFGYQRKKIAFSNLSFDSFYVCSVKYNNFFVEFNWGVNIDEETKLQELYTIFSDNNIDDKIIISGNLSSKLFFEAVDDNVDFDFLVDEHHAPLSYEIIHTHSRYPNGALSLLLLKNSYGNLDKNKQYINYCYKNEYNDTVVWKSFGDIFLKTSAIDLLPTDFNLFETIYINNPHDEDIQIYGFIAS